MLPLEDPNMASVYEQINWLKTRTILCPIKQTMNWGMEGEK
jgi:hypothetical protein